METAEQGGMEVRAMAGTEAHTSHLPAHPQTAKASAPSQHPAAPVKHFPSFLQEDSSQESQPSHSRPQAEEPFPSSSSAPPAP